MHCSNFLCRLVAASLLLTGFAIAEDNSHAHIGRARKVLIGGDSAKALALINQKGDIEWQVPLQNIHDVSILPNGNILYQTNWTEICEMSPDRTIVWKYDAARQNGNEGKKVEVHAFQRLDNGNTMIAESGTARIIEVDANGQLLKEIPLKVEHRHPHTDSRLVRKLENGNYLVAHEGQNKIIREYDGLGAVVWEYPVGTKAYSAMRLKNGNTLIGAGDGHRVIEVDKTGKTVWSVEEKELPDMTLGWVTMVDRLPNGNTLIVNCHGGDDNPQIVEVDPNKKVVWAFKDIPRFGTSLPVALIVE